MCFFQQQRQQSEMDYKVVVLGGGGVGKSAITIQFIQGTFVEAYDPTIEDSYRKILNVDGSQVVLSVLDTAGQEEYRALRDQHIRTGDGFLLVFSLIEESTFQDAIKDIFPQILRVKDTERVPLVLMANKCDLKNLRTVSENSIKEFSEKNNIVYFETSAKEKKNIDESFYEIVRQIRKTKDLATLEAVKEKKKKCLVL
jgi:GTPase KRas protein